MSRPSDRTSLALGIAISRRDPLPIGRSVGNDHAAVGCVLAHEGGPREVVAPVLAPEIPAHVPQLLAPITRQRLHALVPLARRLLLRDQTAEPRVLGQLFSDAVHLTAEPLEGTRSQV